VAARLVCVTATLVSDRLCASEHWNSMSKDVKLILRSLEVLLPMASVQEHIDFVFHLNENCNVEQKPNVGLWG